MKAFNIVGEIISILDTLHSFIFSRSISKKIKKFYLKLLFENNINITDHLRLLYSQGERMFTRRYGLWSGFVHRSCHSVFRLPLLSG